MENPQDLAKAYLDQWQQQWSQMAADPTWQAAAQQQWQQYMNGMMQVTAPSGSVQMPTPSGNMKTDDPRTASPPPASDLGAQLLAECFMRMARPEARVADLESRVK